MIEIKKQNTVISKIKNKKKEIIFSLLVFIALMFSGNILAKQAAASCTATLSCGGGGTVSCTGQHSCSVGSNSVKCDDVTATCY